MAWVREHLVSRRTPPKGAARFIADRVVNTWGLFEDHHGRTLTAQILGSAEGAQADVRQLVAKLGDSGDGRAQVLLLAMALGTLESRTPKDAWRAPSDASAAYLRFLSACGYPLGPVEQIITGEADSETVYADSVPTEPDQPDVHG